MIDQNISSNHTHMHILHTGIIAATAASTAITGAATIDARITPKELPIIERIAERFHINADELRSFFAEQKKDIRAKHETRAQTNIESRIEAAIKTDRLTNEQAALILRKRAEMKAQIEAQRASDPDMTPEEKRIYMNQLHTEIKTWANIHDIDMSWLMPQHGHKPFMMGDDHKPQWKLRIDTDAQASQS